MILADIQSVREVAEEVESKATGQRFGHDSNTRFSEFDDCRFGNGEVQGRGRVEDVRINFKSITQSHVSVSQFGSLYDILSDRIRAEWKVVRCVANTDTMLS